ncbi:MAG: tetratricopeptide repeat protein, partial [Acidobacteriota bacterium]
GKLALAPVAVVVLVAAGWWLASSGTPASTTPIDSIAVLPLANADPATQHLSYGIAEALIFKLADLDSLRVTPSTSAFRFTEQPPDLDAVRAQLDVRAVLIGRLEQRGNDVNISLELVDLLDDRSLGGWQYESSSNELLALQEQIARDVTARLGLELSTAQSARMAARDTESEAAQQEYFRGRLHMNNRSAEGLELAAQAFRRAIDIDPTYARAWTGLADTRTVQAYWGYARADEAYPEALQAATTALELDDELAEAHASMGLVQQQWLWEYSAALASLQRAMELDPEYAAAYAWYAGVLGNVGRDAEGIEWAQRAIQLDRMAPLPRLLLASLTLESGDPDGSLEITQRLVEDFPDFIWGKYFEALVHFSRGEYQTALEQFRSLPPPNGEVEAAIVLAAMGQADEARAVADAAALRARTSSDVTVRLTSLAAVYMALGDNNEALDWLEVAADRHSSGIFEVRTAIFAPLFGEPRFQALLERLNLPPITER